MTLAYPYRDVDPQLIASLRHVSAFLAHPVPVADLPDYLRRCIPVTPVVDFPQPDSPSQWLIPRYDTIPLILKQHDRWMLWTLDGEAKKVPRRVDKPATNTDGTKASNWRSYDQLIAAAHKLHGPAFALGPVDNGPTLSGIDLDKCRNPKTGVIQEWAWKIIRTVNGYTEISPSGTGVKIFVTGTLPEDSTQGKVYRLEIYDRKRYFTVTGHHLAGNPMTVESREPELRALYARQRSTDLVELVKLFGLFKQDRGDTVDIVCPWAEEHSGADSTTDVGLHRSADGQIDGFHCFHASHAKTRSLGDVRTLFGLKGSHAGFLCNAKGDIIVDNQENIRRALDRLGIQLSHDVFAEKMLATQAGRTQPFDDAVLVRSWLLVDEECRFRPSFQFFQLVLEDTARGKGFHPVRDYLNGLTWDGTPRINNWLFTYAGAEDSDYIRAIAAIVLIAAVRRIRQPGCKYDEMLVLESPQGLNKSSALRALCPDEKWFSDDLPLHVDAKRVIEATLGKWIIEASDLAGKRKAEVEQLKATLSRQVDGPARMAYAHTPVERARHFIIIGSTNSAAYLNDSTGARRFWPVAVKRFDLASLLRDRDQLWAEAATREAAHESIRLPEALWPVAAQHQEARREEDAWEEPLIEALTLRQPDADGRRRVATGDLWDVVGVLDVARRDLPGARRLSEIMQRLGYRRSTVTAEGKVVAGYIENGEYQAEMGLKAPKR